MEELASYTTLSPWFARRLQEGIRLKLSNEKEAKDQAVGGGRFWMGARAGLSTVGTGKLEDATKRKNPNDGSAKTG
jgi:hypothetical protein